MPENLKISSTDDNQGGEPNTADMVIPQEPQSIETSRSKPPKLGQKPPWEGERESRQPGQNMQYTSFPVPQFQVPYNYLNHCFLAQSAPLPPFPMQSQYFNQPQTNCLFPIAQSPRNLVDLPPFDGSAYQWSAFITAYRTTNDAYAYDNFENHMRLRKAITGEAFKEVQGLLINPSCVAEVILRLEKVFGRPDTLVKVYINDIRRTPTITDVDQLIRYSRDLNNMVESIRATGAAGRLNDYTLLDDLIGKLPMSRKEDWFRYYTTTLKCQAAIPEFASWLEEETDILRMARDAGPQMDLGVAPINPKPNHKRIHNKADVSTEIISLNAILAIDQEATGGDDDGKKQKMDKMHADLCRIEYEKLRIQNDDLQKQVDQLRRQLKEQEQRLIKQVGVHGKLKDNEIANHPYSAVQTRTGSKPVIQDNETANHPYSAMQTRTGSKPVIRGNYILEETMFRGERVMVGKVKDRGRGT